MTDPQNAPVKLAEEFEIDSLETLKVVADPLRKRIIDLLALPNTVKVVAKQLGMSASKLYYHFNLLEEHGIIQVTDTRIVSGIIEKQYRIAARRIRIKTGLLSPTSETGDETLTITLAHMLDSTGEAVRDGVRQGIIHLGPDGQKNRKLLAASMVLALEGPEADAFYDRLEKLIDEFTQDSTTEATPNEQHYNMLLMLFPVQTPVEDEDSD
jgi:DNA-binding transcriptional ArsR family regulator